MCVDKNNKAAKKNDGSKQAIRTNGCCGCGNSSYAHFELLDNQKMILLGIRMEKAGVFVVTSPQDAQCSWDFELAHSRSGDQN